MSNTKNTDNPNSQLDPQSDLRDLIQILPEEWAVDRDDLADFQANDLDGE